MVTESRSGLVTYIFSIEPEAKETDIFSKPTFSGSLIYTFVTVSTLFLKYSIMPTYYLSCEGFLIFIKISIKSPI